MPNSELPNPDHNQSLVLTGPQGLRQPVETLDVSAEEIPHLLDYWHVISKRRWVVLSCILIVFTTVAIGTLKKKPIYEGKVLIEINPEQPNVTTYQEVFQLTSIDIDSYRETQYKIMQSRTLAEHVVDNLKLYLYPEFYKGRFLFELIQSDPDRIPKATDPEPVDHLMTAYRNAVKNFIDSIEVSPVRRSNLVELSFDSENPETAARIANRLANDYIDQNLQVKFEETMRASEWLQGQLPHLKANLEKSEDALQSYARANSIIFVEEKQNLANERLKQLQEAYTKAQAERYQKESMYSLVQAGRVQDLPGTIENRLIQDLSLQLAESQRDYAQMTATYKPEYPKAIALKKQIDAMQASLNRQKMNLSQSIIDSYRTALANEKYLAQAVDEAKKEVNDIAEKSIQYNILKRQADSDKQIYDGLNTRMKEATVSAGVKASNIRIVDAAQVPKGPVKPRVPLNLALGIILGAAAGIGLALFQEYLDNTLRLPMRWKGCCVCPHLASFRSVAAMASARPAMRNWRS